MNHYEVHAEMADRIRTAAVEMANLILEVVNLHDAGELTDWEYNDLQRLAMTASQEYLLEGAKKAGDDLSDMQPVQAFVDAVKEGDPEELSDRLLRAITVNRPTSSPPQE